MKAAIHCLQISFQFIKLQIQKPTQILRDQLKTELPLLRRVITMKAVRYLSLFIIFTQRLLAQWHSCLIHFEYGFEWLKRKNNLIFIVLDFRYYKI